LTSRHGRIVNLSPAETKRIDPYGRAYRRGLTSLFKREISDEVSLKLVESFLKTVGCMAGETA